MSDVCLLVSNGLKTEVYSTRIICGIMCVQQLTASWVYSPFRGGHSQFVKIPGMSALNNTAFNVIEDAILANTRLKERLQTPTLPRKMTCHELLERSWTKFSCGQVISLIENSWCHILQFHLRLPFVEMVLSMVLKY